MSCTLGNMYFKGDNIYAVTIRISCYEGKENTAFWMSL